MYNINRFLYKNAIHGYTYIHTRARRHYRVKKSQARFSFDLQLLRLCVRVAQRPRHR